MLDTQLRAAITHQTCISIDMYNQFFALIKQGRLTREENLEYHCCVFFIPFNRKTKEVFIVHHKKAKQWVVPGGHIEKGELLEDAVQAVRNKGG